MAKVELRACFKTHSRGIDYDPANSAYVLCAGRIDKNVDGESNCARLRAVRAEPEPRRPRSESPGMAATPSLTFGMLLKRYRLAAGLTQEGLAERAGVSARGVQDLER